MTAVATAPDVTRMPDFTGYATRNDMLCSDGRTILRDAFKDNDGAVVPLVYQHSHDDILDVLGHARLENVDDGVKAHAFFNQTTKGQAAKEAVRHGDIKFLSIFANQLVERAKKVLKGNIREVSLVLAGANPGATIEAMSMAHSDNVDDPDGYVIEEANITTGIEIELAHSEDENEDETLQHAEDSTKDAANKDDQTEDDGANELQRILATYNEEQERALNYLLTKALTEGVSHADDDGDVVGEDEESEEGEEGDEGDESEESDTEGADSTESQDNSDAGTEGESNEDESNGDEGESNEDESNSDSTDNEAGDAVQHNHHNQEDNSMTSNVFDRAALGGSTSDQRQTLSHSEVKGIMEAVVGRNSSLKQELQSYALQHGIENIDYLFPDFKTLQNSPQYVTRRMEWVDKVLGAVRKAPFARIKTITADITPDEARARGYITGNMKNEEFFELSKRETTPQTVYKKQKLDRDDVIDIADLDVVAWLKAEMKVMLDEEIASAILFGDGRSSGDEDKIRESNIRPIASDSELYVTTAYVNLDDANSSAEELVDAAIVNREFYKGSGQPTFYTTQAMIAKFKLAKDGNGQRYYKSNADIAAALDVADVVAVETMGRVPDLVGIMVNLADYTIGTDRGGQATMFDDFDLDYNKLRYLLETRLSGALTTPKAAVVFRKVAASSTLVSPDAPAFNKTTGVLTVPTKTGVTYKNSGGTTLTTGSPVTVPAGQTYKVFASPASASYYFADNAHDEFTFTTDPA